MSDQKTEIMIAENYKQRGLIAERIAINNHNLISASLLHDTQRIKQYRDTLIDLHYDMYCLCRDADQLIPPIS